MTQSEFEQLKFIQQLLSDLNPLFIAIFIFGIITGVFFFTDLVNRLDRLSYRFRVPRRIKAFDEINQMYVYLYRFKGKYYGLAEFEVKKKEAIASYKSFHKKDLSK
ncbi:hypothetical protein [Acinetobacter bereziniae]|uniref:hypothetical protein n=1 Tax=Acinetobacter bereziniae TaxID=106648 RepID=UPI0018FF93F1|nr:hypothetical protein [Acinetobacter bereziniae]MBJ9905338.1 hypothetical protein [Acinetobacter bereziniae]MCU4321840.1 hypothetical protein [Acinetobacter bereziniae]MCU4601460.1 hypothetical protein [Acinetobacter bereziniae]